MKLLVDAQPSNPESRAGLMSNRMFGWQSDQERAVGSVDIAMLACFVVKWDEVSNDRASGMDCHSC